MKMHRLENYDPDGTLRDKCESTSVSTLISVIRDMENLAKYYTSTSGLEGVTSKIIFEGNRDFLNQIDDKNKLYEFIFPDGEIEYMILTRKQYVEELARLKEIHGKKIKSMDIGKYLS